MESGLVGRVRGELESVVLRHPTLDVRLRVSARWRAAIRSRVADHLLQVVREAVHNARLHGGATLIEVSLGVNGRRAEVVVGDDGRGLDDPRPGRDCSGSTSAPRSSAAAWWWAGRPGAGTRAQSQRSPEGGFGMTAAAAEATDVVRVLDR